MNTKLPTQLLKKPLVEAIFEVRFSSKIPASSFLPGFICQELKATMEIGYTPAGQIPKQIRDIDPNLKFAPICFIHWNGFSYYISDFSVAISCGTQYPGWTAFKQAIIQLIEVLTKSNIVDGADRYSMKYVDLIRPANIEEFIGMLNLELSVASHNLEKEQFQINLVIPKESFTHTLQIISSAVVAIGSSESVTGAIIDIDTHTVLENADMAQFRENLIDKLDNMHEANKKMFFDCLTDDAINLLEPIYD